MSLEAIKIVEEEIERAEQLAFAGPVGQGGMPRDQLLALEDRIKGRIMKELVEIPEDAIEDEEFLNTEGEIDRERELGPRPLAGRAKCGCAHHAEEGEPCPHDLALSEEDPADDVCLVCGEDEDDCTGGGFDDGVPAHDFRPNVEDPACEECGKRAVARFIVRASEGTNEQDLCNDCPEALMEEGHDVRLFRRVRRPHLFIPPGPDDHIPF